jgi:hypothetical protein
MYKITKPILVAISREMVWVSEVDKTAFALSFGYAQNEGELRSMITY